MMRISPFAESTSETADVLSDEDRVNMWPLAYHNRESTSILWPLIDFDKDGFAVRPLLNKDGTDWSLLWPLAGWDTDSGEGWVANTVFSLGEYVAVIPIGMYHTNGYGYLGTAYWDTADNQCWGMFPVCHIEPGERGCVLTTYWDRDGFGTFPLFHIGEGGGYIGPFWAGSDNFGMFPLYSYHGDDAEHRLLLGLAGYKGGADEHTSWMFPLWYDRKTPDSRSQALLPLYFYGGDEDNYLFATLLGGCYDDGDVRGEWMLPFWWSERGADRSRHLLFPLAYSSRDGDSRIFASLLGGGGSDGADKWMWLFPSYWSSETANSQKRMLFPFWFQEREGDSSSQALVPFFYHTADASSSYTYTPLANWYEDGAREGLNIYPFWWSARDDDRSISSLVPFYFYREKGAAHTLVTPLGGYGWHDTQDDYFVNVLGPLYHHQESHDGAESLTAVVWPLYTQWRDGDERHQLIPGLYHRTADAAGTDTSIFGGLGRWVTEGGSTSTMLWPLVSTTTAEEMPNFLWDFNLFHWQRSAKIDRTRLTPLLWSNRDGDNRSRAILPFYHGITTPTEQSHYVLAYTGGYHSGPTGSSWRFWPIAGFSNESERPDFLYYLSLMGGHRYESEYAWHVTPFIGSVGDDSDSFSWALPAAWWWRDGGDVNAYLFAGLGNYNRDDSGSSWHLLPIAAHSSKSEDPNLCHWLSMFRSWTAPTGENQFGITPFINYHVRDNRRDAWIFPLCHHVKDGNESSLHTLIGLQHYGTKADGWSLRITPALSLSTADDAEDGLNWLSAIDLRFHDDERLVSLLGPFGMRYQSTTRPDGGVRSDLNYALLGHAWNYDLVDDEIPLPRNRYHQVAVHDKGSSFFLLYRNQLETFRIWDGSLSAGEERTLDNWRRQSGMFRRRKKGRLTDDVIVNLLSKYGMQVNPGNKAELHAAVLEFAKKHSKFRETRKFSSLPFTYKRSGKDVDWKFLLGVAGYKHVEHQDQSTLSVLRYLYRRERKGEEIRRTFFPFSKWDSGADKSSFSFCWRLFDYRRNGANKGGHILFIPWGNRG